MTTVRLHQALHGYADGHRLIAASTQLSQQGNRALRVLTDLSGPRLVAGFDDYLSGYSLPDDRMYAFTRTWYAEEAERPGCVWTHSLLLDIDTLPKVFSLLDLLPFFRRPQTGLSVRGYEDTIDVPLSNQRVFPSGDSAFLEQLVTALYGKPAPVVIPDANAWHLERLYLCIWQHYRELTGSVLQFCTGSIQFNRECPTGAFDLQTVPIQSLRDVRRTAEVQVVGHPNCPVANWAQSIVEQFYGRIASDLKMLFEEFATVSIEGRATIGSYMEVFELLRDKVDSDLSIWEVVDRLQNLFPNPKHASRLKRATAGSPDARQFFVNTPDWSVLQALVRHDDNNAFSPTMMRVQSRMLNLWKSDADHAILLLRDALRTPNDVAFQLVNAFADTLRLGEMPLLLENAPDIVLEVISRNYSLCAFREIWQADVECRQQVLDHLQLANNDLPDEILFSIVSSQLDAEAIGVAFQMVRAFQIRVADAISAWLIANKWRSIDPGWQAALTEVGTSFTKWIEGELTKDAAHAFAIPPLLTPYGSAAASVDTSAWVNAATAYRDDPIDVYRSALFLLVLNLGLSRNDSNGESLTACAFSSVYLAARYDEMSIEWWHPVESHFAASWWWDRCRTLRVGLVTKFALREWSPSRFLQCLPDSDTFAEILSTWGWGQSEKAFLARVINDTLLPDSTAPDSLKGVARQYARWF